jgi:hypothetical protein
MSLEPLEIELSFVEAESKEDEDDETTWPVVRLDISGVEPILQPLVLKLMSLVRSESVARGAKYTFDVLS